MTDLRQPEREALQEGVFRPSRAEIAREMKCRLNLGDSTDDEGSTMPHAEIHN